jgi:hypothetical protein
MPRSTNLDERFPESPSIKEKRLSKRTGLISNPPNPFEEAPE